MASAAGTEEEEFEISPQQPVHTRAHMANLDLNSQSDFGGHQEPLTALMQSDGGYVDPPASRGGRSGRGGFQAPRPLIGGGRSGRGGSQVARGRGGRSGRGGSAPSVTPGVGGGGRGRRTTNRGRASTSTANAAVPTEEYNEQYRAPEDNLSKEFDKANWTEENTRILCDLAVEQIREGNCPNGTMKTAGYKAMAQKYYEQTNLLHEPRQIKNRYTQCKTMYQWLNWANGETGLGRGQNGSIIADDPWWEKYTQGY